MAKTLQATNATLLHALVTAQIASQQRMRGIVLFEKVPLVLIHHLLEASTDSKPVALVIDRALEPDLAGEDEAKRRLLLRGTPRTFSQEASPCDEIRRTHPGSCLRLNKIHLSLFLVAESGDTDDGKSLPIYRADWNGEQALSGIKMDKSV